MTEKLRALREKYWAQGYIDRINVLSSDEVALHRKYLEDAEAFLGQSLHYQSKVHTVLRSPYELATHPTLLDLVEKIIGPDILLHNVTYIIKEPQTAKFASFHQDLTYWGFDGTEQVSAWLALSLATPESGCMRMIPGSHRGGLKNQVTGDDPENVLFLSQTIQDANEEDAVFSILMPGQASLHHGWTIHASGPNSSRERRIGVNAQYISPKMKQLKDDSDSAILVRGEDRYRHFISDQPATEWLPPNAGARLKALTAKYESIAGVPTTR